MMTKGFSVRLAMALTAFIFVNIHPAVAQQNSQEQTIQPMGQWVEFKTAIYSGAPILVHLRTGYERAILMPEPVRLLDDNQKLPNSDVVVDSEVVGFYPAKTFTRRSIKFVGLNTGAVYDLRVRASPQGIRQPLEIKR